MREKRIAKIYHRELFGALALYAVLLTLSIYFGKTMAHGALRTVLLLTPMVGFGATIWAIARHLWREDEYMRQRLMENIALAAAMTAGLCFTYGFLELAGFPRLSMFTVWCVLCGSFGLVQLGRKLLAR